MPKRDVTLGLLEMEVEAMNGNLEDGVLQTEEVEVGVESTFLAELTGSVSFQSDYLEDALKEAVLPEDCYWPDTLDNDNWEEPAYVGRDTKARAVLQYIITNPFCTTGDIQEEASNELDVRNIVYQLKKDNLVRPVGRAGSSHLLVPTHLGYKEHFVVYGTEMKEVAFASNEGDEKTRVSDYFESGIDSPDEDES